MIPLFSAPGAEAIPPGRKSNPSGRRHRLPIAGLAVAGLGISSYLALFQLDVVDRVWDPVFGFESSREVLESSFSRALPVPDALIGAVSYALEVVLELAGRQDRWFSRPALPLLFGAVVVGAAAVSILLLILQAFVFESFCALCLTSAAVALTILPLALPEVLAAAGAVRHARRHGAPLLDALAGPRRCQR